MACKNCKKTKEDIASEVVNPQTNSTKLKTIRDYFLKFLLFLLFAALLTPFIIPIVLVVLFRVTVLSKTINLLPVVKHLGERIFKDKDEEEEDGDVLEDDEAYDNEDADDYELENPHELIVVNNVK